MLILTAIVISALSGMANEQSPAKQNERYSWPPGNSTLSSTEVENLHESAEKGNVKAQVKLGRYYFSSNGVDSFQWFKKAAEKAGDYPFDSAEAQTGLGWCYKEGKGVEKNEAEAEKWLRNGAELETKTRKAAELANAKAQVQLAFYYAFRDNRIEAFKWFKKAAENTDSDSLSVAQAQHWLGMCFLGGQVVEKNEAEAEKWLKKSYELSYNTYRERAEQGDAESAHDLGDLLLLQTTPWMPYKSLPEDEAKAEAAKWFKKSAELGFAEAQNTLGWIYNNGDGVQKDEAEAFKWFSKAAEQGHAKSQLKLGHCYASGDGVPKDEAEAVKWYRKAAEQGLAGAQNILGNIYLSGVKGVKKDEAEAVKWYRMGADQGDEGSQTDLGRCYAQGIGVPKNNAEALKWFYKVAKRNRISAFQFGRDYYNGWNDVEKNLTEAVKFFQISAERGHDGNPFYDDAQFQLGVCYENGEGVPKDEAEAVKWYRKAAEQGHAPSQRKLGEFYEYGKGVQKDKSESKKWYRKAAEQGVRAGEFRVDGVDVEKKQVENLKWYRKAAEMGFADAQYAIARCYFFGDGVPEDKVEAEKWYRKAADQGNQEAKDALEKFLKDKQPKLALLIANSNYSHLGGLARTIPDAKALANVLNSMGFEVYLLKDGSREQILDALKSFENKVRGTNALAFFHFGGHGIQVEGKNYLIPADAEIPDERRVTTRAVDLDEVIASLESAKPKASVLVVDACRHNPLPATATRSATRGLAVVGRKPKNSVIIFAAEAGNEALDGLFTPVFAKALSENREKSLNQIMQKVRSEVFNRSNGTQTPGEYNQLFDDVYLYKVN